MDIGGFLRGNIICTYLFYETRGNLWSSEKLQVKYRKLENTNLFNINVQNSSLKQIFLRNVKQKRHDLDLESYFLLNFSKV